MHEPEPPGCGGSSEPPNERRSTAGSRLAKLLWFVQRPRLYGELARKVTPRAAIELLTDGIDFRPLSDRYPEELSKAGNAVARAPVEMGAANLELLYYLAEHLGARNVIETGVAYGWSALALLLSLHRRPDPLLVSTDLPYAISGSETHVGVAVPRHLRSQWRIIKRPDRSALPEALALLPAIDMCHYDSAKAYEDRMWAYPRLWGALRPGGLFLSDDVGDNEAFRDFCAAVDQSPVIVEKVSCEGTRYVGVLAKPRPAGAARPGNSSGAPG